MICINCRNEVVENTEFCPHCGTKFNTTNIENKNQSQMQSTQYTFQQFDNNSKNKVKIKKNRKKPTIILILAIVILIGGIYIGVKYLENDQKKNETTPNIVEKEEEEDTSVLEKLKIDYKNDILTVNEYFKQLVYMEYDSSKLDSKYSSTHYSAECEFETDMILEQYYEELDENIVRFYLTNKSLANVSLGDETFVSQTNNNVNYEVRLLNDEVDKSNAFNHKLNKVYLSKNGNFLIWYTDIGDDAITVDQLQSIADGLENTIDSYEQKFGVNYSYNPYIDNKYFNNEWTYEVCSFV